MVFACGANCQYGLLRVWWWDTYYIQTNVEETNLEAIDEETNI